jgi:hypothetical protein
LSERWTGRPGSSRQPGQRSRDRHSALLWLVSASSTRRNGIAEGMSAYPLEKGSSIAGRASSAGALNETRRGSLVPIRDIPSEAVLTPHDGMTNECAVNCDYLQTVPRIKVGGLITTLDEAKMSEVSRAVRFALNL